MADENINEQEELSIKISELPNTSTIDNDNDYLILSHPTTNSTSDYLTYKIHPGQLASQAVEYTAGDHIAISSDHRISATYQTATTSADGLMSSTDKTKLEGINPYTAGDNISISNNVISATDTTYVAGDNVTISVEDNQNVISATDTTYTAGNNITISANNEISADSYTLPIASASTLGGIKVGENVSIDSETGVLSATDTTYTAGTNVTITGNVISADNTEYTAGTNISIDSNNEISANIPVASTSDLGGVIVGSGLAIDGSGVLSATGGGGGSSTLAGLSDVDLTTPIGNNQVLGYNSTSGKWENMTGGSGATTLASLNDVNFTTPTDGESLVYDATTSKWLNGAISYNDLVNTPTIPAAQVNSDWNSSSGVSEILNKPNLATVATSGSYTDLSNTPTIPDALSELTTDVAITTPDNNDVLKYDSSSQKWVNATVPTGASALDDLTDVDITNPSLNQVLKYDGTSWVNGTGSGGASALDDLTDVDITTPSEGDTLVYDSTNSKWVNGAGGGGGSAKQTAVTQAQYDALVQTGTVDPTMEYFITDGIPSSVEYYHNYSTTEHIVGSWIDGSIIYEKTYTTDFVQGSTYVDIDVSNENIDTIFSCEGLLKASPEESIQQMVAIPYGATNLVYINIVSTHDGYVRITRQQGHFYGYTPTVWITIRYSKSST